MNKKVGLIASLVTLVAVLLFAASLVLKLIYLGYLASLFIAWGFVPMIAALATFRNRGTSAAANSAIAFSAIYAALISLVFFAQLTTLKFSELDPNARAVLDFQNPGSLYFNFFLLGYAFMALATFFAGLTIEGRSSRDQWLKGLLLFHGIFAVVCLAVPLLNDLQISPPIGDASGSYLFIFWCVYFLPICILAYQYFFKQRDS